MRISAYYKSVCDGLRQAPRAEGTTEAAKVVQQYPDFQEVQEV
jgi:hypothetical protein